MRSLLLGIDVSPRRLGWGLVDLVTGEAVACGCENIELPDHGWQHQQVAAALGVVKIPTCVKCWNGQVSTFSINADGMGAGSVGVCKNCRGMRVAEVQAVYMEDTAKAGKFRQHDAGRAQGIAQDEVERRWPWVVPVQFMAPAEWKKEAGMKGNASKPEITARAITLGFGEEIMADQSRVMEWVIPGGQDAADAACIAYAGWVRNQDIMEMSGAAS